MQDLLHRERVEARGAARGDATLEAELALPAGANPDRAQRLLERRKRACTVSNSLATPLHLERRIAEEAS